jgi:hypothetical protein
MSAPTIRYRVIERVGANASEWTWMEVDEGTFTVLPGRYCDEPTIDDARRYAEKFNTPTREIQFREETS